MVTIPRNRNATIAAGIVMFKFGQQFCGSLFLMAGPNRRCDIRYFGVRAVGMWKIRHFQGLKMTILSVFEPGFQVADLKFCPGFRRTSCFENGTIFSAGSESKRKACILCRIVRTRSFCLRTCYHNSYCLHQDLHEMREINCTVYIYNNQYQNAPVPLA